MSVMKFVQEETDGESILYVIVDTVSLLEVFSIVYYAQSYQHVHSRIHNYWSQM